MRVSMVSEHASPLAVLGGVDAGGQNVYVAALSLELARRGIEVVVHTRRDDADLPRRVEMAPGVVVDHVDAGPPEPISHAIDRLLPYMDEFAADLARCWSLERPDVVHSHFWMSGRAALAAAEPLGVPVVHTRRDDPTLPQCVPMGPGVVLHHVDAGPARPIAMDLLLPYMDEFAA